MIELILYFLQYGVLLVFGVFLSARFAGVLMTRKNILILLGLCGGSAILQLLVLIPCGEIAVRKLYPMLVHLPMGLLLWLYFRKKFSCILSSIAAAYLCCQPARWFGMFLAWVTGRFVLDQIGRILVLVTLGLICLMRLGDYLEKIFAGDNRSNWILGVTPVVYYVFDYFVYIYGNEIFLNRQMAAEFLPCFLCVVYLIFCTVYHRETQQKAAAERKAQLIRFTTEQQARDLEVFRSREQEIRLIRHDIRLLLSNISACVDAQDWEKAQEMIASYAQRVDATVIKRYCESDILNYILNNTAARCEALKIDFKLTVELHEQLPEEVALSTILSNALDNAINAQKQLPEESRHIKLMMKNANEKLLLSVTNPVDKQPIMVDGMPVSETSGHGYGTQSIRHLTEELGGKAQFTVENRMFILRVVI